METVYFIGFEKTGTFFKRLGLLDEWKAHIANYYNESRVTLSKYPWTSNVEAYTNSILGSACYFMQTSHVFTSFVSKHGLTVLREGD